jgi:hypothetical protein
MSRGESARRRMLHTSDPSTRKTHESESSDSVTQTDLERQRNGRSSRMHDSAASALVLLVIASIGPSALQLLLTGQPWLAVQLGVVGFALSIMLRSLFRQ